MSRVVAFLIVWSSLASAQQAAEEERQEVLLIGSSSVNGAWGRQIEFQLERLGINVVRRARSASGFARPDFVDWEQEIDSLGALDRYATIVMIAGGNDTQDLRLRPAEAPSRREQWVEWEDEERWRTVYRSRVRSFVGALCGRGARSVVMLLPLDGGRPGWSRRIIRVREEQAAGAEHACGHSLDVAEYPTEVFESADGVHLNREGARRAWARLASPLRALLHI
jgi:hypothetical protein